MRWGWLFLFLLTFTAGCTMPFYGSYYEDKVDKIAAILDPVGNTVITIALGPGREDVVVFACENPQGSDWLSQLLLKLFDPGLVGVRCGFYLLNETTEEEIGAEALIPRAVDVGAGATIVEFQEATAYCNNSMRYAVSYIIGDGESFLTPTSLPFITSQTCLAYRSILPVYVMATPTGRPPSHRNEYSVAVLMQHNPSLVVYMRAANNSTATADVARVVDALQDIKAACPRCLVGLGMAMGDTVWPAYINNTTQLRESLDFVAFGVDTGGQPTSGAGLVGRALGYFGLLRAYTDKPVFIHYTNLEGMTDYEARVFYTRMFSALPSLASMGLIGYVGEDFYEEKGPFGGSGLTRDGEPNQKKFSMFFYQCRHYYNVQPPLAYFSTTGISALPHSLVRQPLGSPLEEQVEEAEPPIIITKADREEPIFDCSPCAGSNASAFLESLVVHGTPPATDCGALKANASYYAGLLYFDPAAVMALSQFADPDPCSNIYYPPWDAVDCYMPLKAEEVESPLCQPQPMYYSSGQCGPSSGSSECRICFYGPLKVPWPPGHAPPVVEMVCGEDFDPYDREDAYCAGAVHLSLLFEEATRWVEFEEDRYFITNESRGADLLTLTAISYFHGNDTAREFLELVAEVGDVPNGNCYALPTLHPDARDFCCDYDPDEGEYVLTNPLCDKGYSPAELFVRIHRSPTPPNYIPTWQRWKFETEEAYRFLKAYVGVSKTCRVCDEEAARERFCQKLEEVYGEDVCAQYSPST